MAKTDGDVSALTRRNTDADLLERSEVLYCKHPKLDAAAMTTSIERCNSVSILKISMLD